MPELGTSAPGVRPADEAAVIFALAAIRGRLTPGSQHRVAATPPLQSGAEAPTMAAQSNRPPAGLIIPATRSRAQ
jgi:hypothetical protein